MIVVSNTTPLRYLVEIDAIHILPALFENVLTTPAVLAELLLPHFPQKVRDWALNLPSWIRVESPHQSLGVTDRIDPGEAQAIALAKERAAMLLLIDEEEGVRLARSMGIAVLRTLTLLAISAEEGLISLDTTLARLAKETRFRATPDLFERFLHQDEGLRKMVAQERLAIQQMRAASGLPTRPAKKDESDEA